MKKKIYCINGRFLTQKVTGVQRYAYEMVNVINANFSLLSKNSNVTFVIIVPGKNTSQPFFNIPTIRAHTFLKGHLWEQLILPWYCINKTLINFCNTAPILKRNQFVTIHDASIFVLQEHFSFIFNFWYKILWQCISFQARHVFTDSVNSKKDLCQYLHVSESKVSVHLLGNDHIERLNEDDTILKKHELMRQNYLLVVGSLDPRKNLRKILLALKILREQWQVGNKIVIVGGMFSQIFAKMDLPKLENVIFTGRTTDEELKSLYLNALCLIYPSLYEGFGFPVLEAMTLGCPVITSKLTSLPEVGGDNVIYCNANDEFSIALSIKKMLEQPRLRAKFGAKGQKHSSQFKWSRTWCIYLTKILEFSS